MISANKFIETLQSWAEREQSLVSAAETELKTAEDALATQDDERLELWQIIANVQSAGMETGETISDNGRIARILRERVSEISQVEQSIDLNRAQILKHREKLADEKQRRERISTDHERARFHFESGLERDEPYQAVAAIAQEATDTVADLQRRLEDAEAERDEKIPAYESDLVFMHLVDRQYDTENYRAPFGTRALDQWMARRLNYAKAKQDYDLLTEMPKWLRAPLQNAEQQAEIEEQARVDCEAERRAVHDISAIDLTLADADNRVAKAERDVSRLVELGRTLDEDRAAYGQRRDARSIEIRDVFMTLYGAMSTDEILQMAKQTASREDEDAVSKLSTTERSHDRAREALTVEKKRVAGIIARRDRIEGLINELIATGIMDSRHTVHEHKEQEALVLQMLEGHGTRPVVVDRILSNVEKTRGGAKRQAKTEKLSAFPGMGE